jgi:phosphoenolpyruvate-protein phosphotransferase
MDIHARLVEVLGQATSPASALDSAARVIAEEMGAEACTIFVQRGKVGLEPRAYYGVVPDQAYADEARALAEHTLGEVLPRTNEPSTAPMVAVPVAAINHAIGAIVTRRAPGSPFATEDIMRLSGVAAQMVESIESMQLFEAIDETRGAESDLAAVVSMPPTEQRILRGVAAAPGIAIGVATFRNAFPRALVHRDSSFRGALAETARVRDALQKTHNDLVRLQAAAASEIGEEQALIFGAHLLILSDGMVTRLVDRGIAAGRPAPIAIDESFDEIVRRLSRATDPYVQERVEDLEDLRSRLLGHVLGVERQGSIDARVVISNRTTPSLVVELKAHGALGLASELGGPTSHSALLARALGIPAVSGIEGIAEDVVAGDLVIVDGDEGLVIVRPSAEARAEYGERVRATEERLTEFARFRDQPARTADGRRFQLQANIALGADLEVARENAADGVGLYRTEFPFIVRDALPSIEEQTRIYAKAFDAFPDAPVTFRILDLAGDKFLPRVDLGIARDAFHGYRSIRVLFDYPHVLRDQVRAFAAAATNAGKDLRILIPMVSSLEDVVRIKRIVAASLEELPRARAGGPISYGAMIETPAAVELVAELAREVDFFSIGTNDLVQYALVVDREDPRTTSERHAYHPAVWRMIRRVVRQARDAGKPVSVCGEIATRPDVAIGLLALGVDSLSVTPRAIPGLKRALARLPLAALRSSIDTILASSTTADLEAALRAYGAAESTA